MNIMCNNKGCFQSSEALLNDKTMEVVCRECGQTITNVSESMKRTLKQAGQIVRSNLKKAFMVFCRSCNANRELMLDEKENTVCKTCQKPVKIQASFKLAMKELGYGLDKSEDAETDESADEQ